VIASRKDRQTGTLEELAFSNTLTMNPLAELLDSQDVHHQNTIGSKSFDYSDG
jgi:hypothetical protein